MDPSGIRLGTPALTTRGFNEAEMRRIGEVIVERLRQPNDDEIRERALGLVKELTDRHPLYPELSQ
jgi:glycine hydroxymethyltransferase